MSQQRIEQLQAFLAKDPNDSFTRYALGLEHVSQGDLQTAVSLFLEVLSRDPAYVPAYQQVGYVYERLGQREEAAAIWKRGVEAAVKQGDIHAQSEIQEALDALAGG